MNCPSCNNPRTWETVELEERELHGVKIKYLLPITHCLECEESFTDHRAEDIRTAAYYEALEKSR